MLYKRLDLPRGKAAFFYAVIMMMFITCSKKNAENFVVMAHRGASAAAPENTLVAYEKAIMMGADYAELDVRQTKDGAIVLMHDKTVHRTTGVKGFVWDFTLEELKQLEAGSWFGEEFKGEPIPTLEEVIRLAKGRMKLNIEVKISENEPGIAKKVVDIVRAEDFSKDCVITSFDMDTVKRFKEIAPDLRTGLIFDKELPPDVFEGNWEILSSNSELVDADFMRLARKSGKETYVWTVNEREEMLRLIGLGVDGIITDKPDLLRSVLMEVR
ncbi:MAG: glycerophosphodiester phosphodiesterase family protein [Candidatus Aminicenantes bacterium]|jgi:glycerophosphoryl diester phosphodiesterase